jgi:hypothetical protein
MSDLGYYAKTVVGRAGKEFLSGEVFAKVLTPNDDSGRHGVLVPSDAYSFFPDFQITDPSQNQTQEFSAFDCLNYRAATLAYKYYERYPERRITRLHNLLNKVSDDPRILVFVHVKHTDGSEGYYFDCANSGEQGRFQELFRLIFGDEVSPQPGKFVVRPIDSETFAIDPTLADLLEKFDAVNSLGWIPAMRSGDTGIGYTFEKLLGIEENNDKIADFNGIEIKCKGTKEGLGSRSSKINLFQAAPVWTVEATAKQRIRILGKAGLDGLYTCYSQVTTTANNLGLSLGVKAADSRVDLRKNEDALGYWPFQQLEERLAEKHSRAVFVKAKSRLTSSGGQEFHYQELVYCDRPTIDRFVTLVSQRNIVFEFTLSEKPDGSIRNHGYPWRLIREAFLEHLFAFQIKLR